MKRQQDFCTHAESKIYDKNACLGVLTRVLGKEHAAADDDDHRRFLCCTCSAAGEWASDLGCGHALALDTDQLELYCQQCNDYVYLEQFDEAALLINHQLMQQQPQTRNARPCYIPDNDPATTIQAKRQKLQDAAEPQRRTSSSSSSTCLTAAKDVLADNTSPTAADVSEAEAVLSCLAAGSCSALHAADGFPLGLRGLNNLGNTCFMNSVLQVMLHAPLLSSFFLGEGHDPTVCPLTARDRPCLACQMDAMFAEMYCGSRVPFSPAEFLYHWWRHADSLAGYQQQDAHEFYLSLLEGMSAATVAMQQQQQQDKQHKQQTPAEDAAAPQQQQVGLQPGSSGVGAAAHSNMLHQQRFTAVGGAHEGGGAGLDVLGRPTAAAAADHQPWAQHQHPQQQQQQFPLALAGGLDLQLQGGHLDWQQFSLQQLLQQHGLDGWAQGYGSSEAHQQLHQQSGQVDYGGAGVTATPEPGTADVTLEPQQQQPGCVEGGSSLVELLFSGLLRSDVRCCACGHTSTAHDPFRDISLDLHVPRPPKLPPAQPHHRTQAAAAAIAAKAAAATSQQQQMVAGSLLLPAATIADVSPAPHPAAAAVAEGSCVTNGGVLGREVTPPLLLVTPSPTPPPSELLGDYWDNADDEVAAAAAGQLASSRYQSPAAGAYSGATSLSTKPESISAAAAAGEGGDGVVNELCAEGICSDGLGSPVVGGTSHLVAAADGSTGTSLSPRVGALSDLAAVSGPTAAAADQLSGDHSPHSTDRSDLGGPAASQSSQQIGAADTSALTGSGLLRDTTPEPASTTDGAAAGEASHNTPQQQHCPVAGVNRESTPQSQQHAPHARHQHHQQHDAAVAAAIGGQGSAGVASGLVRGVGGGLGQLVRAPVAAIKQLLPAWSAGTAATHQQQQRRLGTAAAHHAEGDGDSMGALPKQLQQIGPGDWHSADLQNWQQQQHSSLLVASVDGLSAGSAGGRGSSRAAAAAPKSRQQRCGSCKYCLNRHLKKGCEANKKLREEAKAAAAPGHHHPQPNAGAAAAAAVGLVSDPATTTAVPFGGPGSAATQPAHPLGGIYPTQQQHQQQYLQQQEHQQQHVPQQQDWLAMHQYTDHWQQQQQSAPLPPPAAAATAHKPRTTARPAGSSTAELLAAAAVQQGLMKKRDERGRFYRKEALQAWALQLYEEGRLTVDDLPAVSPEAAAAARARGLPEPPAALAAQAAAAAAGPQGSQWGSGKAAAAGAAATAGVAAKASSKSGVRKGSAGLGSTAAAAGCKKQAPPPPQLRMNDLSLAGCLRRFVRPERLGPAAHWRCSGCGSTAAALKQMSIRRLPLVLCFHVKRFEHGGAAGRAKKLDVPMRFPLRDLDMAPFTASEVLKARVTGSSSSTLTAAAEGGASAAAVGSRSVPTVGREGGVPDGQPTTAAGVSDAGISYQQQCLYELFGVVSHSGDMASGHYVSYVKCDGCWYLINDPWVVAVAEADVAAVQAYMLFYAQEHLFGTGGSSGLMTRISRGVSTAAAAVAPILAGSAVVNVKQEPIGDNSVSATMGQMLGKSGLGAAAQLRSERGAQAHAALAVPAGDDMADPAAVGKLLEEQASNKAMALLTDVAGW